MLLLLINSSYTFKPHSSAARHPQRAVRHVPQFSGLQPVHRRVGRQLGRPNVCESRELTIQQGWFDDSIDFFLGNLKTDADLEDFNDANMARIIPSILLTSNEVELAEKFTGAQLREVIVKKWAEDYDVEFTRTDSLGKSYLYLTITPWTIDRKPFRHASEADYNMHLQAVAEYLTEWGCVSEVLSGIAETAKKPRRGTVPILTVPIRLSLTDEKVKSMRL